MFGADDSLSRQQFVTMLYRLIQKKGFGYQNAWAFTPKATDYGQVAAYAKGNLLDGHAGDS